MLNVRCLSGTTCNGNDHCLNRNNHDKLLKEDKIPWGLTRYYYYARDSQTDRQTSKRPHSKGTLSMCKNKQGHYGAVYAQRQQQFHSINDDDDSFDHRLNKKFKIMLTRRAKAYSLFANCQSHISIHFVATFTGVPLFDAFVRRFLEPRK